MHKDRVLKIVLQLRDGTLEEITPIREELVGLNGAKAFYLRTVGDKTYEGFIEYTVNKFNGDLEFKESATPYLGMTPDKNVRAFYSIDIVGFNNGKYKSLFPISLDK